MQKVDFIDISKVEFVGTTGLGALFTMYPSDKVTVEPLYYVVNVFYFNLKNTNDRLIVLNYLN
jgi:hypothetical protein